MPVDFKLALETARVQKRNGDSQNFDSNRIYAAVLKAGCSPSQAEVITDKVLTALFSQNKETFEVEKIQDLVEEILFKAGLYRIARAYAVYRERHKQLRNDKKTLVEVVTSVNEYLERSDWRVNANANQGYSLGGLILNVAGKVVANYWLSHVYSPSIGQAHRSGDFHVHDLDMLSGYCAGWSLRNLLIEGFNGVPGKAASKPPKHLRSALGQIVNFLGTLQNEWAGAQAFSSFDTYLAPFIRLEKLRYEDVEQCLQEFIFNLNVPSRWGSQAPFTNLTFDWKCPEDLQPQNPVIGGTACDFTYGELQAEMDMINKAYLSVMVKGDANGRVFTFPIPTYNITSDFEWDGPNTDLLFDLTAKYGLPYFQNFINSDLTPGMVRSMCCRLQLDLRELLKRGNGLFGSAEQTGSIGVVTLNVARIGYLNKGDAKSFYEGLDYLLDLAKESLEVKRKVITRHIDDGLFPFTKRYLGTLKNHFSTIGVNGINEAIRNFFDDREDITTERGKQFALTVLDHIRAKMIQFQEETGNLYNLEASPAEGATYRFAREDKKRFPDILQAGFEDAPYYTNSSQLPTPYTEDPFFALSHQEELQRKYTGGTVFHMYLGEAIPSAEMCRKVVRQALNTFKVPYLTITPTFSICPTHGYIKGEHHQCPTCGEESEVWTRVMGYHRPFASFNKGKQSEFKERTYYEVQAIR